MIRHDSPLQKPIASVFAGACALVLILCTTARAQTTEPATQPATQSTARPRVYLVGYAHLDTQWRWSYPQVISEFLLATLKDNFNLFEKYPDDIFNFTGANRYMLFKEYYPQQFEALKRYVNAGRWFPAGSSLEEGDANMPSGEALIRQVLYGNEFFRAEFGKASAEFMLPDTFGFQASLPSLLAHCGLKGFSTQKLSWGSAAGIPFNVGRWIGPDGKGIIAAFNPGSYAADLEPDIGSSPKWTKRLEEDRRLSGSAIDYHYYGVGDRGGAVTDKSLRALEKSVHSDGPIEVISSTAEQMFLDLTAEQIEKLPKYAGDLLLTNHSAGSLTSEAFVKRCNRKGEQLAQAAEHAAVLADWLGAAAYPMDRLNNAWRLLLINHFHDILAGTALPRAFEYVWNNYFLCFNEFAAVETDSIGAIASELDTQARHEPLVVYNPCSFARTDVVETTIEYTDELAGSAQLGTRNANGFMNGLLLVKSDPMSVSVVDPSVDTVAGTSDLKAALRMIENDRLKVTINDAGDIASIFDKQVGREVLSEPARLVLLNEKPKQYPAWNMDWADRQKPPRSYVSGPATIELVEKGPVRATLRVTRDWENSHYVQEISLAAGAAGDAVVVKNIIDWRTAGASLKAVFPLTASNPSATYESQSAAVLRGSNDEKKFEVPQQRWFDLTDSGGGFGVAVLNDGKYGSDKPDEHTLRLTLLYTPAIATDAYQDQGSQDWGRQEATYAIYPHAKGWQEARVPQAAARLNQPLRAFYAAIHEGALGRSFSFANVSSDHVTLMALKKAEDGDGIVVRLNETSGQPASNVELTVGTGIENASEIDGQERPIGAVNVRAGKLAAELTPFALRSFRIHLRTAEKPVPRLRIQPVQLPFDADAVTTTEALSDGTFDMHGRTYPASGFPKTLSCDGVEFAMGSTADGQKNAVVCRGQTIELPAGNWKRLYLIAAASDGAARGEFKIGDTSQPRTVQDWSSYLGQWDNRQWRGAVPALAYEWKNKLAGLAAGFTKRDEVVWYSTQRHDPVGGMQYYQFSYLFKYGLDVPAGGRAVTLPDEPRIKIFAMTLASGGHDDVTPAAPLYDTLDGHPAWTLPATQPASESITTKEAE